eukprot:scaffold45007_cov59-Phaeocystis_antarctica.AAC.2
MSSEVALLSKRREGVVRSRHQLGIAIRVGGRRQSLALLARDLVDGGDARLDIQRVKAWMHRGESWARAMTGPVYSGGARLRNLCEVGVVRGGDELGVGLGLPS